jgi:hypothetical protein
MRSAMHSLGDEHELPASEAVLAEHPALSEGFQRIALGLRARWQLMSTCTVQAEPVRADGLVACTAPIRLQ